MNPSKKLNPVFGFLELRIRMWSRAGGWADKEAEIEKAKMQPCRAKDSGCPHTHPPLLRSGPGLQLTGALPGR